jgi:hypothetical protein
VKQSISESLCLSGFFWWLEHDIGGGRNTCALYFEASYGGKGY